MNRSIAHVLILAQCLTLPSVGIGQVGPRTPAPQPGGDEHAELRAAIEDLGLTPDGVQRLQKQKFLITSHEFQQAFQPYANPHVRRAGAKKDDENADRFMPMFVTADAVLNAFHVQFEESVARLERRNAMKLRVGLAHIWLKLPEAGRKDDPVAGAAREWAQIVVGTAIRLNGGECPGAQPDVVEAIEQNLKLARAAEGTRMPVGGEPPDNDPAGYRGVDFTALKPRGFYAGEPLLAGYFRSVAWLQQVQFRTHVDREVTAAILIAPLIPDPLITLSASFDRLVGPAARPQLVAVRSAEPLTESIDNVRRFQLRHQLAEMIREQRRAGVRFIDEVEAPASRGISVLAPRRLPELELFRRTSIAPRLFPSGLDLLVALGSDHASKALDGPLAPMVRETAQDLSPAILWRPGAEDEASPDCLYVRYLYTIAALLLPAEPDAPDFLKSELWELKQCQTALAGWAQLRHAWVLQAEQSIALFSGAAGMPGFVEPIPVFWNRLEKLVLATQQLLKENGVFDADRTYDVLRADLAGYIDTLNAAGLPRSGKAGWESLDPAMRERMESLALSLAGSELPAVPAAADATYYASIVPDFVRYLRSQLRSIEAGQPPDKPLQVRDDDKLEKIRAGWTILAMVCDRLETLSHRQLRKIPLVTEDAEFLEGVGVLLGAVCFHNSVASAHPRDDAPRVADIHRVQDLADRPILHVGVGRPRELLVLYPWNGKEVLCRGAVMPYHEFRSNERLTDTQWRAMLDTDAKPALPEWTKELYHDGGVKGR